MITEGKFSKGTPCKECPLRPLPLFRSFEAEEIAFVSRFKIGELVFDSNAMILAEGEESEHLFTVLSGWGFRYKMLDDGRRQIMNYVMPGDIVGLQGTLMGEMQHSIESLSPVVLCVFQRSKLAELYRCHPELAYDLTWIAAREERMLDENLLSIGRRSALERAAYLIAFLYQRAASLELFRSGWSVIPITQQHVADTLGLSLVHTNKTLKKLAARGLLRWAEKGCDVHDIDGLLAVAGWDGLCEPKRPLI
ncbi:cyclic nucleotide-binding domain-containing protein [Sinorhizobium medicae]|uniref:Crp/Fnr family transcriptional regulator n=2 Tax=Sinorhizobium medicae TaxID=110321 RepID=A0A508WWC7_9HYPH|nr:Crp/Fnr family transcriptional regulator [Sinorhizobium medicae]ABR61232.1 putative transcriptional regulator, Crp/Fnr family [Sinorhizobium medicae WSM419]MBO1943396.1 Crp/Fnr family transcriptional regulator [Sinorhizobium medicae]MBO1959067.1 Crp/Fnr family transcriptional regulator [Sinorhizobium medicae]MDX0405721.1 cyclic nucleotide-binding domain-containing protein [Sinorhizobium medicae]MDX0411241.1 cyclic nucleotide-binding domain-containing protein [Sinorhizobium medicae]